MRGDRVQPIEDSSDAIDVDDYNSEGKRIHLVPDAPE